MKTHSKMLYIVLFLVISMAFTGCTQPQETTPSSGDGDPLMIDWVLHGVWMTPDGRIENENWTMDFSLKGTLPTDYDPHDIVENVELDFIWPLSFQCTNEGKQLHTLFPTLAAKHENQHIYHGVAWLRMSDGETVSMVFTICPEEGFVVFHLGNESRYFVSSTDPSADPAEIFEFYKTYAAVSGAG